MDVSTAIVMLGGAGAFVSAIIGLISFLRFLQTSSERYQSVVDQNAANVVGLRTVEAARDTALLDARRLQGELQATQAMLAEARQGLAARIHQEQSVLSGEVDAASPDSIRGTSDHILGMHQDVSGSSGTDTSAP